MAKSIKETLTEIGLTKGEIDVYLALLELGLSTTGKITKESGISSSKVYEVLQRLISKGLASYVIENGKHHYSATSAERLVDYLEDKKRDISEGQEEIRKLIPSLESKRKSQKLPEATIYRGRKGALVLINDIINDGKEKFKNKEEYEVVGCGNEDYVTYFPSQVKEYVKIAKKFKFKERLIFGKGVKTFNNNAKIRYLPPELNLPVRTVVYGDKVAIIDFEDPMTLIIIEKKSVAKAYINYFNALWKIAKP